MIGDARFDSWQVCASATTSRISVGVKPSTHIHLVLRLRNSGVVPPQGNQCSGRLAVAVICSALRRSMTVNPLPVQFKALLHGQKGCLFFSGHLNLRTAPETGLPSREKNHNN